MEMRRQILVTEAEPGLAAEPTHRFQAVEGIVPNSPAPRAVEETVSDAELAAERGSVEPALRTKEEVAYYRVWRENLQGISAERTLSRFARA